MSKTTVLVFNGGSVSGDNSVDAHNLHLEAMPVNLTESTTSSMYVLVDKAFPIEVQPHYAPVDRYAMREWLQQGDIVQIDCSNLVPTVDDTYSGILQSTKDTADTQGKQYTSACAIRVDIKADKQIESRFYDLEAVQDAVTGIWYLACPVNTYTAIKYPVTKGLVRRIAKYTYDDQGVIVEAAVDYDKFDPDNPTASILDAATLADWARNNEPMMFTPVIPVPSTAKWGWLDHIDYSVDLDNNVTANIQFYVRETDEYTFRHYDISVRTYNNRVFFTDHLPVYTESSLNKRQTLDNSESHYPSCKCVKEAITASHTFVTIYDGSVAGSLDAHNHTLHVFSTQSSGGNLILSLETENDGKAPADFAAEIECGADCDITLLINGIDASESIAGGHSIEEGKFYQLTCFGSCFTLAEFTKPNTVQIGGTSYPFVEVATSMTNRKLWMAIPLDYQWTGLAVGESSTSLTDPQANYYNDDSTTHGQAGDKYGLLYNGAATQYLEEHKSELLPKGWRLPTYEEIQELATFLGGYSVAGLMLKSATGWDSGTGQSSWDLNFKPTGIFNGSFSGLGSQAILWASGTASSDTTGCTYAMSTGDELTLADDTPKQYGCAIRLVKDLV